MDRELETYLKAAEAAAREAGAYVRSRWSTTLNVEFKGEINIVTEVDKAAENMIVASLRRDFSDHDVMTEEGQAARKDSPYKWIVDPLDGTVNFAHGHPLYCVSIALEHAGRIIAGVVFDPMRGELFAAARGLGATLNGSAIRVSKHTRLIQSLIATGFSYTFKQNRDNSLELFRQVIYKAQGIRRDGVAAVDLCYVACGRYDGFWELSLFPWDVAAGVIIIEEAGGTVTRFDGSPFSVYDKEILATNGLIHAEMSEVLRGR